MKKDNNIRKLLKKQQKLAKNDQELKKQKLKKISKRKGWWYCEKIEVIQNIKL